MLAKRGTLASYIEMVMNIFRKKVHFAIDHQNSTPPRVLLALQA
jgi:hypothetical protein